MPRAERLSQVLDFLRARDSAQAEDIADELGVSLRTVYRDIAALREQGLPISGEPGPGGGIRLERTRGVASVHLSTDEVVSLWLAAQLSRSSTALPWGAAARSALDKLLASVPDARARELRALLRRVVVGPPATANVAATSGAPPRELLAVFEVAFARGVGLGFDYEDRNGVRTSRRVEPHGPLVQQPVWYVLAFDLERAAARMFRMDRISRARPLEEVRFTPRLDVVRELTAPLDDLTRSPASS